MQASANKGELAGSCTEKKNFRYKQGLQEWLDLGVQRRQDMFYFSVCLTVLLSSLWESFFVRLPLRGGPWLLQASPVTDLSASEKKSPSISSDWSDGARICLS